MKRVRALMILVLLSACIMSFFIQMSRRSKAFELRADHHYELQRRYWIESNELMRLYHSRMAKKYYGAAARPWLFVPSDLPEPHSWRDLDPFEER
jgi:type II secretory pathway component PulJ